MLLLAGSSETHLVHKGAFQELDAISLLTPHVKLAVRPSGVEDLPRALRNTYRTSWYGRPGPAFVDLPADYIQGRLEAVEDMRQIQIIPQPPPAAADEARLLKITQIIKNAKAPLVVIGKGETYA